MREVLAYELFDAMGVPVPRTSFVDVWVNDTHLSVYTQVEQVDRTFLDAECWCDGRKGGLRCRKVLRTFSEVSHYLSTSGRRVLVLHSRFLRPWLSRCMRFTSDYTTPARAYSLLGGPSKCDPLPVHPDIDSTLAWPPGCVVFRVFQYLCEVPRQRAAFCCF